MTGQITTAVFRPSGKTVRVPSGTNLLDLMRRIDIDLAATCGGKGKCGKCKVKIEEGAEDLPSPTETELQHLLPQEIKQHYRLACSIAIPLVPYFVVKTSSTNFMEMKLQTEGRLVAVTPDPAVSKHLIELADSLPSDEETLLNTLREKYGLECTFDYEALTDIPAAGLHGKGLVTCVVYDRRSVVAVEPGDTTLNCLGFAADIGTTKLALYLMDLLTGKELASSASPNPQAIYGDDVMSRIAYSLTDKSNNAVLQKAVLKEVASLVRACCTKAGLKPKWIYEGCFVGNPCMVHFLLGISARSLAFFPYRNVFRKGMTLRARELPVRLNLHPAARLHVLPLIAGFVGADTVAARLAVEKDTSAEIEMLLDIGTNTEVLLSDENGSMACSCASGPAFEGMHISHGRKADSASIEKVWIDPATLDVRFQTIDGAKPAGLCGSGIASVIAELLKVGILSSKGKLNGHLAQATNRIRMANGNRFEFVIAWKQETSIGSDIVVTQKDVLEVQKAKAAIYAGCELLMKQKGVTARDIDRLIIAGAFGQYVDKAAVKAIGMFPDVPIERIEEVGNAAGVGAKVALLSRRKRQEAEEIAESVTYYELALDPDFVRTYASSMLFPAASSGNHPSQNEKETGSDARE